MSLTVCVRTRKTLVSDTLKHLWTHLVSLPALRHISSHVVKRECCQFWIADDYIVRVVRNGERGRQNIWRLKFRKEQTGLNEHFVVCENFGLVRWFVGFKPRFSLYLIPLRYNPLPQLVVLCSFVITAVQQTDFLLVVYSEIIPTRCNNCVYSSQWLYSTCFGWQFHPSSGVQCFIWPFR